MSRTPKINPAVAALDAEIATAERALNEAIQTMAAARALVDGLRAAASRMRLAEPAAASTPRAARGSIEKAIGVSLGHGPLTAEQLQRQTGANAKSIRSALARMKAAGTVTLGADDRYSLAGAALQDAAQ